jgi:hypothetical protein
LGGADEKLGGLVEALASHRRVVVHPPFSRTLEDYNRWGARVMAVLAASRLSASPAERRRRPLPVPVDIGDLADWSVGPDDADLVRERLRQHAGRATQHEPLVPVVYGLSHHHARVTHERALMQLHLGWAGPVVVVAEMAEWRKLTSSLGLGVGAGGEVWGTVWLASPYECAFLPVWHSSPRVSAHLARHADDRLGPNRTWRWLGEDSEGSEEPFTLRALLSDWSPTWPVFLYGVGYSGKSYEMSCLLREAQDAGHDDRRARLPLYIPLHRSRGALLDLVAGEVGLDGSTLGEHLRALGPLLVTLDALDEAEEAHAAPLAEGVLQLATALAPGSAVLITCREEARAAGGALLSCVQGAFGLSSDVPRWQARIEPMPRDWLENQLAPRVVKGVRPVPWDLLETRPALLSAYAALSATDADADLGDVLVQLARDSVTRYLGIAGRPTVWAEGALMLFSLLALRVAHDLQSGVDLGRDPIPLRTICNWYLDSSSRPPSAAPTDEEEGQSLLSLLGDVGLLRISHVAGAPATDGFAHEAMFEAFLRRGLRELTEYWGSYSCLLAEAMGGAAPAEALTQLAHYIQRRTFHQPTAVTGFAEAWFRLVRLAQEQGLATPVTTETIQEAGIVGKHALKGNPWSYFRVYRGLVHEAAGRERDRDWGTFGAPRRPYVAQSAPEIAERYGLTSYPTYCELYERAVREIDSLYLQAIGQKRLDWRVGCALAVMLGYRCVCGDAPNRNRLVDRLLPWLKRNHLASIACVVRLSEALLAAECPEAGVAGARRAAASICRALGRSNPVQGWVQEGGFATEKTWSHTVRDSRVALLSGPEDAFAASALWSALDRARVPSDMWVTWSDTPCLRALMAGYQWVVCIGSPAVPDIGTIVREVMGFDDRKRVYTAAVNLDLPASYVIRYRDRRAFVVGGWTQVDTCVAARALAVYGRRRRDLWGVSESECEAFWQEVMDAR